jgi:UDP-N-acetylmuramoyl-tripeptide--D-alanyl-D-alanine ligase
MEMTLVQIAQMTSGILHGPEDGIALDLKLDSRQILPGDLLVCLVGERVDGHSYVEQAFGRGAIAVMVERDISLPATMTQIRVSSTQQALFDLASGLRKHFLGQVIAITGTAGKTTTKDFTVSLLASRGAVHASMGNLNTELGIPLIFYRMPSDTQFLVLELGLQKPGDIRLLAQMVRPDIGLITEIGPAHLEYLGSVEQILAEKWELLQTLPDGATILLNYDSVLLREARIPTGKRAVYFGMNAGADLRGTIRSENRDRTRLRIEGLGGEWEADLPFFGSHLVRDFLGAFALGLILEAAPKEMLARAEGFELPEGRGRISRLAGGVSLIDESYNANPLSVRAALDVLAVRTGGRRIAVLGDMLELGQESKSYHRQIGKIATARADMLFFYGPLSADAAVAARQAGMPRDAVRHFLDRVELTKAVKAALQSSDCLLVKGSRGMHLEELIRELE